MRMVVVDRYEKGGEKCLAPPDVLCIESTCASISAFFEGVAVIYGLPDGRASLPKDKRVV